MHLKYKKMIRMVFGDGECTYMRARLISSGEAQSYNYLPLSLQAAEEEQHSTILDSILF